MRNHFQRSQMLRRQSSVMALIAGCFLLFIVGCSTCAPPSRREIEAEFETLNNSDVTWNHGLYGLDPVFDEEAARFIVYGKYALEVLIDGLKSMERYVISHALLVRIAINLQGEVSARRLGLDAWRLTRCAGKTLGPRG